MRWEMKIALCVASCTLVAVVAACSGTTTAGSASLTDGDSGKTVELATGGTLKIDLEENGSTGFSWQTTGTVPAVLKAAGDESKAPEATGVVGAAGRRILSYEAVGAGEGDLRLVYVRPWETGVAPAKTFEVHVVVK